MIILFIIIPQMIGSYYHILSGLLYIALLGDIESYDNISLIHIPQQCLIFKRVPQSLRSDFGLQSWISQGQKFSSNTKRFHHDSSSSG